jgi:OmcA/MtrC family decaheme c-type cytochrome
MNAKDHRSTAARHARGGLLHSFLLTGLLFGVSACNNSSDPAPIGVADDPVVGTYDALPGVVVAIQRVYGGSGPSGAFRVGDKPKVDFTIARSDGEPLELSRMTRGAIMVSGPTANYQRVIASQSDLIANAVKTALGAYTYTFSAAIPAAYLAPLNDSALLTDGELTGQALVAGTYTVGIELRKDYTVGETTYRDPGIATANFLFGSATTIAAREVVKNENCTQCHGEVRAHGNNRNDVRSCVLCHTAGAEDGTGGGASDVTPGATIDFGVMIHKIHSGRHLPSVLGVTTNADGTRKYDSTPQPYQLIGFQNSVHDYSEVSFPQWPSFYTGMPRDAGHTTLSTTAQGLENTMRAAPVGCAKCHGDPDGGGPLTAPAQGDVIFTNPTRRLCTSCHDDWDPAKPYRSNTSTMPEQNDDASCKDCHGVSGDPLAVVDAHRHPLVDPALAPGVNFDVTAVTDVGGNANGKFEPGEKVGITFSVKDDAGNAIAASSLSRIEVVISGPTTNPQALNYQRFGQAFFSGTGPYTVNMPAMYFYEPVGSSTAALETFTTANTPHWNVTNALTSLLRRTGTGAGSTLAAAAAVTQNYIDVAPGTGTNFAKDNYIVIDDGNVNLREYLRIQWVDGDRLWFGSQFRTGYKPNLTKAHATGATVTIATTSTVPTASWTLVGATGVITETVEFGTGEILATYTADWVIPAVYPGALDDSPVNGLNWGDWTGTPLLDGTYLFDMHGARGFTVTAVGGETTSFTEGADATVVPMLFGAATNVETVARIEGASTCYACHDSIQFHGGSRRSWETCISCHGTAGAENTLVYENQSTGNPLGTTVEFRNFLHHAHAEFLPITPGGVMDCASCHGANNTAWQVPADRQRPNQSTPTRSWMIACSSCHESSAERAHIDANTSASGAEACAICHGSGEELRVEHVHVVR